MKRADGYHRPSVATDICVFNVKDNKLRVLLIVRGDATLRGYWALPGGFLRENETLEECAERELMEETNVRDIKLNQFGTYSALKRDPRERVISIAYYALIPDPDLAESLRRIHAGTDAAGIEWFSPKRLPELAFDHRHIIKDAVAAILHKFVCEKTAALTIASSGFTAQQLQEAYNCLAPKPINDYSNFMKLIRGVVVEVSNQLELSSEPHRGRPQKRLRSRDA